MSLAEENKIKEIINDLEMDENQNFIKSERLADEYSAENLVAVLVPRLKNLQLTQKSKSVDSKRLAGYVRAVIPACGTVVVSLATGSKILDIGTAIFALIDDETPCEIGFVSDIFGNVSEPMYSLELGEGVVDSALKIDEELFYLCNHPSTGYISVKREANDIYTIVQNRNRM